jgi:hypothetical protein
MALEEKKARYVELCHAMQTGVAYSMEKDPSERSAKHLRVGINSALANVAALADLLMAKGIFTEDEYWDAVIKRMEAEVKSYEDKLRELYGGTAEITLK